MKKLKTLTLIIFLFSSYSSIAQNQNSQEHHRQFNPQHPGYDGNNTSTQPQRRPSEIWENKYGAIAYDPSSSSVWSSEDQPSLRAARRDALQKCGRKTCRIVASATNACLAAGHGSGKGLFGSGNTRELAIQDIQQRCSAMGVTCEIGYVHCNVPVRIR